MAVDPNPVARSVEQLRRQFGLAAEDDVARVRRRWPELIGPARAAVSDPVALRDGTLRVETSEPAVLEALRWSEERIVAALREGPEPVAVDAVRAVVVRRPAR